MSHDEQENETVEPTGEAEPARGEEPAGEAGPAADVAAAARTPQGGGGRRLLGALVTVPWAIGYGVTGAWSVTRGARAFADGLETIDAGYTRTVTPTELMYVGALLLAAFAVMLACALLLLYRRRSAMVWLPLLLISAGLTAGSVWAAVKGGLHPILWVLFFFGLAYVTVIALVQVTRAARSGRIERP